jgi:hypothetical protein
MEPRYEKQSISPPAAERHGQRNLLRSWALPLATSSARICCLRASIQVASPSMERTFRQRCASPRHLAKFSTAMACNLGDNSTPATARNSEAIKSARPLPEPKSMNVYSSKSSCRRSRICLRTEGGLRSLCRIRFRLKFFRRISLLPRVPHPVRDKAPDSANSIYNRPHALPSHLPPFAQLRWGRGLAATQNTRCRLCVALGRWRA